MRPIRLIVNGAPARVAADPAMPLLWALRDVLGLRGTRFGCGQGQCGACTVLKDGAAVKSCQLTVGDCAGARIVTIEGLSPGGDHPVQRAWIEEDVSQCGYCQAGMILATVALLQERPDASEQDVEAALRGNLCRCGSYPRVRRAVRRAAEMMRSSRGGTAR